MNNYEFWALLKDGTELLEQNLSKEDASKRNADFMTKTLDLSYACGTYEMSETTSDSHKSIKRIFGVK
jgi:hypothetical protein